MIHYFFMKDRNEWQQDTFALCHTLTRRDIKIHYLAVESFVWRINSAN